MSSASRVTLRSDPAGGHPLVDREADLTPTWLTAVLRGIGALPKGEVTAVRSEPVGHGLVATTRRLHLSYDTQTLAPSTLVAKMTSVDEASRKAGAALGVYEKEVRFYQDIAPRIGAAVAPALFADVDHLGERFLLLMDDLFPARSGEQIAGCNLEDAAAVLDAAAAIHAPFWGRTQIDELPWIDRARDVALYVQGYRAAIDPVLQRFEHSLRPEVPNVICRLGEGLDRYYAAQPRPWTVTHQDFRLDNLLFDAKNGAMPVAVLDWQTVRIGPGVSDVAYFIGAGLPLETRRTHERDLLERYRESLRALGVDSLPSAEVWQQYRRFAAEGLITALLGASMVTPTERGDRLFTTMIERHAQHMIDLDTLSLMG
ncbi:ecdysteroid kinase [Panacagrimonas perspica]|uniref:Ecdysteroid kinase n=1 Tax=Panacagrimonas perspica TaxID=381431 RepID=A0A4R7NY17_9GAMM|nr:phosphotransferase [Panacagrimonas perspica]TDU25611.1 ecdysteroid kinase [Panacagrimonas perspica]